MEKVAISPLDFKLLLRAGLRYEIENLYISEETFCLFEEYSNKVFIKKEIEDIIDEVKKSFIMMKTIYNRTKNDAETKEFEKQVLDLIEMLKDLNLEEENSFTDKIKIDTDNLVFVTALAINYGSNRKTNFDIIVDHIINDIKTDNNL